MSRRYTYYKSRWHGEDEFIFLLRFHTIKQNVVIYSKLISRNREWVRVDGSMLRSELVYNAIKISDEDAFLWML